MLTDFRETKAIEYIYLKLKIYICNNYYIKIYKIHNNIWTLKNENYD